MNIKEKIKQYKIKVSNIAEGNSGKLGAVIYLTAVGITLSISQGEIAKTLIVAWSAVFAGFVAHYLADKRQERQKDREQKEKKEQKEKERENLLRALYLELSLIYERYKATFGKPLDQYIASDRSAPFLFCYPLSQNYLTIFDNSVQTLGSIDHSVAEQIIRTYIAAKGLIDTIKYNNSIYDKHQQALAIITPGYGSPQYREKEQQIQSVINEANNYSEGVIEAHTNFCTLVEPTLQLLRDTLKIEINTPPPASPSAPGT